MLNVRSNAGESAVRVSIEDNQTKKILLTMKEHEVLYCSEYVANLNINDDRFACVLQDTISKKMSFVWNGVRKISDVYYIRASHIDLSDYNKCIIYYAESENYYTTVFLEGKTFGPYYDGLIFFSENLSRWVEYKGPGMLGTDMPYRIGWMFKDYFVFESMGMTYLYERGKITSIPDIYRSYDSENHKYYTDIGKIYDKLQRDGESPNGKYKAVYLNGKLSVNNKVYKTYKISDLKEDSTSYSIVGELFATNEGLVYAKLPKGEVFIDCETNEVTEIGEGKTFDYQNFKIIDEPDSWDRVFEEKNANSQYDVERFSICIQDESYQHTFLSTLKEPYVLIDNIKFGQGAALSAKYDKQEKSFVWTAFEGNNLVVYEVKL